MLIVVNFHYIFIHKFSLSITYISLYKCLNFSIKYFKIVLVFTTNSKI